LKDRQRGFPGLRSRLNRTKRSFRQPNGRGSRAGGTKRRCVIADKDQGRL
jgi:hypothetical protein